MRLLGLATWSVAAIVLCASGGLAQAADYYTMQVTVANGPFAGKYDLKPLAPCNRVTGGMGLYFDRNIEANLGPDQAGAKRALASPKALNVAIVQLDDWDGKSPAKWGKAQLIFGPMKEGGPAPGSTVYEVHLSPKGNDGSGSFQAIDKPKEVALTFDGKTAKGIGIRIVAACNNPLI
jgi:hypothetical protein